MEDKEKSLIKPVGVVLLVFVVGFLIYYIDSVNQLFGPNFARKEVCTKYIAIQEEKNNVEYANKALSMVEVFYSPKLDTCVIGNVVSMSNSSTSFKRYTLTDALTNKMLMISFQEEVSDPSPSREYYEKKWELEQK